MTSWLEGPSIDTDVVISSRIRIARNIEDYNFPIRISMKESDEMTDKILNSVVEGLEGNYNFIRTRDINLKEQNKFVENHIISPNIVKNKDLSSFLVRDDEKATIMINEEDHLRIQTLAPGLNLEDAWTLCSSIDDTLDSKLNYAFDSKYGYLTACPTNVGTGLRASVMVHLPSITVTGGMKELSESLKQIGITIRGIYGEGSKAVAGIYQISNQRTLGESEEQIIKRLNRIVKQIITRERKTREYIMDKGSIDVKDRLYRSYGILKYSQMISTKEAMMHLSNIRTGWEVGIFENPKYKEIDSLMINIQVANLQDKLNKELGRRDRDIERAKIIRDFISDMEG